MNRLLKILLLSALMLMSVRAAAQFSVSGCPPSTVKMNQIRSTSFCAIYPAGNDSLAATYVDALEYYKPQVARSIGMTANAFNRRPLPVVFHMENAISNGSVTWAPSRMELITIPEWAGPSAMPWVDMLSIHEGRHAAQMQLGYQHVFKPFYYIFGEIIPGAAAAYPGRLLLEGDAVVAETALSASGRGRSGEFLSQYMWSLDNGDRRNWMRWRLGSYYHSTPDHYAFGYLLLSGMRVRYRAPMFMADYMDYVSRRPYDPWPLRHTMRRTSGTKFKETYNDILDFHYRKWAADTAARAPYTPAVQLSQDKRHIVSYSNPTSHPDGGLLWVKEDSYRVPMMVHVDTAGREHKLFFIGHFSGRMNYEESDSTIIWNELRRDPRWVEKQYSVVCRYSIPRNKRSKLTKYGKYIYPVEVSADSVAAILYNTDGSENIDYISKKDGGVYSKWRVPDGIQVVEISHIGDDLFAEFITKEGMGICRIDDTGVKVLLPPIPVQMTALEHDGPDALTFECDLTGVNEFYRYELSTGRLYQMSSTKYGAYDFGLCDSGDLAFSQHSSRGTRAMLIKKEDLMYREVEWKDHHPYPIADELSRQEQELMRADTLSGTSSSTTAAEKTKPERYIRGGHFLRFHSWAPCYVNMDVVNNLSYDNIKNIASLGAMGFFQNSLSSFYGYVGYKAAPDNNGKWFHSGHINLTYSGLYPVIEAETHINESNAVHYYQIDTVIEGKKYKYKREITDIPYVSGRLRLYIPWQWNSSSHAFGLIPSASFTVTNTTLDNKPCMLWSAGLRAYATQLVPEAGVFPRWGVGVEAQWIDPLAYFYGYVYIPGICCGQGLKFTGTYQDYVRDDAFFLGGAASILPRGYASVASDYYSKYGYKGGKISLEYAAPFNMGDWHIIDMFYCTRGILTPHFDYSFIHGENLYSVGGTFELEFGSFFWVRQPVTLGITYSYNGGSVASTVLGNESRRHYVGCTFNIDLP